ncbi:hypothetical protein DCO58_00745 [Helicobacter saguini]|uniref:Uncharacterized protein n=1 Tax=Helicobacter saguini TaxID=1548018 RepID=A0A347VR10_9HELI|nr:hypothetical protein [Helicobacter saguini]MWV63082.1 hypothetical protein [Helicobacter saguini]MWV66248.1 hypothetical protein [Helicobacter saguini]MWV68601.1 hypothetical protein [Helicobacter saguini]MWV71848.1 hypothetical protein [Helicobacter saguini]TLD95867.1 hypothetical protein LS64_000425 [Helicobacter saguini]
MEVALTKKVEKYLHKRSFGNAAGVFKVRDFLGRLAEEPNPTLLSNCKKMQSMENTWRWRVGNYRISLKSNKKS